MIDRREDRQACGLDLRGYTLHGQWERSGARVLDGIRGIGPCHEGVPWETPPPGISMTVQVDQADTVFAMQTFSNSVSG
jgi:hypothetical protein